MQAPKHYDEMDYKERVGFLSRYMALKPEKAAQWARYRLRELERNYPLLAAGIRKKIARRLG